MGRASNLSICRTKDTTTKGPLNSLRMRTVATSKVVMPPSILLNKAVTNKDLHLSKREAHAVEDVSVSVWPHCAVAVSAKKVARRALIVPSAVKDAAKNGTYDTTPTMLRARKYTLLRSNKAL